MPDLPMIPAEPKSGAELLHADGRPLGPTLLDFWRWSASDLMGNTDRAILAEYLVALDLGVASGVRAGWLPYDLTTQNGIRVEVKASAYVQSWFQRRYSAISFDIKPKRAWDPHTDTFEDTPHRQAQVYVFCLLHHRDQATIDPLDVSQWTFLVLPSAVLNEKHPTRASLTLAQAIRLGAEQVAFGGIKSAIERLGLEG